VLPRHREEPLPLVISSYRCRGFLRGGIDTDALEYVLASHGVAALCLAASEENNFDRRSYGLYRRLGEEMTSAVDYLATQGVVDPKRVALSGRSMSAEAIGYLITHGACFAAASAQGYSIADPIRALTSDMRKGARMPVVKFYHQLLPDRSDEAEVSPALNAEKLCTPILMQVAESEFRASLQFYYALKNRGKPAEMIVFTNEMHTLVEPRHKRVNAERNIDWFRFWLQGYEDGASGKVDQYGRWREMRDRECEKADNAPWYCRAGALREAGKMLQLGR
jgi:hypothetical protein